jgi:plastocyanin
MRLKPRRATLVFVAVGAVVLSGGGAARTATPSTTGVDPLINVSVRISDTRIVVKPNRVARLETVAFRVVNIGKKRHDFRVGGLKSERLKPGQVDHVVIQFADRGTYLYRCALNCTVKMRGLIHVYSPLG